MDDGGVLLMRRLLAAVLAALSLAGILCLARPAKAAVSSLTWLQREQYAFSWAQSQAGKPYTWGGTGPSGYDCSGLVYEAFGRLGLWLPRTTYEMLGSWHLARTWYPVAGDLAFYGSGHVEFVARGHDVTFGASSSGHPVWWHGWSGSWWRPSMFFHVKG